MDKSDFWARTFAAAVERYGEERAAQVADRAVKEFEKRFSEAAKMAPATPKPLEPVSK